MRKNVIRLTLCAMLFVLCFSAEAQQPAKVPRIGYLAGIESPARVAAFRQGLREFGYVEGKNIVIEYRSAQGRLDRLPALATELVRLKVDVIVSGGSGSTRLAKESTNAIPIVMTGDPDPVGSGFVASLARPGGNITGLSTLRSELSGKRLEILREIVPRLSRVAVFGTSTQPGNPQALSEVELAAGAFGMLLQYLDVLAPKDIESAFRAAGNQRAEGVFVLTGPVINSQRKQIADLAAKSRLPAMYPGREYVEAGGLMSYGVNRNDLDRRAAIYVDKILKGARSQPIFQWNSR